MGLLVLMTVAVGATAVAIIAAIGMLLVLFQVMNSVALNHQIRSPMVVKTAFAHAQVLTTKDAKKESR